MKYLLFCLISVCALFFVVQQPSAQAPAQVAVNTDVADGDAQAGHILSVSADGLKRSSTAYDSQIFGVVVEAPIISTEPKTDSTKSVSSTGTAPVRVSTGNGNIAVGDFITSSSEPGVGQKATEPGYVVGKALTAYEGGDNNLISTSLEIGFQQVAGEQAGSGGFLQTLVGEPGRLKMVLSAILAILVLVAGTVGMLRVVNTGVAAIGRNPLARSTIIRSMVISGSVVLGLVGAGLGVSVAIIFLGAR